MSVANELLLEIQGIAGCPYLSDLHTSNYQFSRQAKSLILAMPPTRYSLQEWNDAASYITGKKCCYPTVEEAKESMIAGR